MTRYLSGLCVAGVGLCGGGWLVVAAVALGGESAGTAGRVNLLTGAVLIAVCCLSLVCWSCAWRQRMRVDGVLADRFLLVSRREARRNRRALSRDVRRAGKLAERSARDARRAARRSARAGGGGVLTGGMLTGGMPNTGGLSGGSVRSAGIGPGGSSPADRQHSVAGAHSTSANGANGANETNANPGSVNGSAGAGAAELISELRAMLMPLLAATGSQPALSEQAAPTPAPAASVLPRRMPSASAFRPRAASVTVPVARIPVPQIAVPRLAMPASDDGLAEPIDSEEAWW